MTFGYRRKKMIYTSYFAMLRNFPENVIPVSICGKAPDWYKGIQYKRLAPKYDFFMQYKEDGDESYYVKCYDERVTGILNADQVVKEIYSLLSEPDKEKDIALICYEKPSDFCHRHLVAEWLNENGYECEEWSKELLKNKLEQKEAELDL